MLRWHPYVGGSYTGGVNVACNGSNINPVALNLLNQKIANGTYLIPTPQRLLTDANGNPIGQSTFSIPSTYYEAQYMLNTDYTLSSKHTLSERSSMPTTLRISRSALPVILPAMACPPPSQANWLC